MGNKQIFATLLITILLLVRTPWFLLIQHSFSFNLANSLWNFLGEINLLMVPGRWKTQAWPIRAHHPPTTVIGWGLDTVTQAWPIRVFQTHASVFAWELGTRPQAGQKGVKWGLYWNFGRQSIFFWLGWLTWRDLSVELLEPLFLSWVERLPKHEASMGKVARRWT